MKYNITKHNLYQTIFKRSTGLYSFDKVLELSKDYKHIYKASKFFRNLEKFTGEYSTYIFTNIEIDDEVLQYLNKINVYVYIPNLNFITLYKIKDKIEVL